MGLKTKKIVGYVFVALGVIVPALMLLIIYDLIKDWHYEFDTIQLFKNIFNFFMLTLMYYGMINFTKPLLSSFNSQIKNKSVIKILTISIVISGLIIITKYFGLYESGLNHNDQGIMFEMIGFFIYLNPINRHITNFLIEKNDEGIDHQLILKTTAVGLVLIGLILQFSYFN